MGQTFANLLLGRDVLATITRGNLIRSVTRRLVVTMYLTHQLPINRRALFICRIRDMDSDFIPKLLTNLFQRKSSSLGPEEVNGGDEEKTPADDQ